jgi:hypothetical protein
MVLHCDERYDRAEITGRPTLARARRQPELTARRAMPPRSIRLRGAPQLRNLCRNPRPVRPTCPTVCHGDRAARGDSWISASDRAALLRHASSCSRSRRRLVGVAGYGEARVRRIVARRLGHAVTVDVLGDVPRRLEARRCVGWMERERGRLQLRVQVAWRRARGPHRGRGGRTDSGCSRDGMHPRR